MASNEFEYLDEEEKDLEESLEGLDTDSLKRPTEEKSDRLKQSAREFLKKEKKMNIRADPYELEKIKEQAAKEGLRYQTFVKSVLHKYITGQLVEKDKEAG